jgi:hypothetical protein
VVTDVIILSGFGSEVTGADVVRAVAVSFGDGVVIGVKNGAFTYTFSKFCFASE